MTKEKIENSTKISIFKMMLKIRLAEETIAEKYSEQKMRCPTHLCIGQEAVSAAVGYALNKSDYAVSTHRSHGHYLGKGGDLNQMIAEIYGKETGCSKGYGGSMHLVDKSVGFMGSTAIVGNSIPVGTGLALSSKIKNDGRKSFIFFGDGAVEQGVFFESINFAIVKKIPAIFVCENNFYSVYSSLRERQPENRKNYKMARAIGIKSFFSSGNDALKCYENLKKAIQYVEKYKRPVFIEFLTYRQIEHCGPNIDDHLNYRSSKEINFWKLKDPLTQASKSLSKKNNQLIKLEEKKCLSKIYKAFKFAKNSPKPLKKSIYEDIYA